MIIKFGGVYCCDGEFIIILLNKENVHSKGSLFGYPMRLLLFRSGQLALNKKIVNRFIPIELCILTPQFHDTHGGSPITLRIFFHHGGQLLGG